MTQVEMPELFFCAGTLMTHDVLERAEAVQAGGFTATSCFVGDLVRWEASGRSVRELRHEMEVRGAPVDTILPIIAWHPRWDPARPTGPAAKHGGPHVGATKDDALRWASEMGATTITLVGPWGGPDAPFDQVVDELGVFCDRAAEGGARLQLEIVPATKLPDVATALALIEAVGRPNLGVLLDVYNLCRGAVELEELDRIPRERIYAVELADAAAEPVGTDYFDDALHARLLPGEGDLDVAGVVRQLAASGPLPPCGFEVMSDDLNAMPAAEVGRIAGTSMRAFLRKVLTEGG